MTDQPITFGSPASLHPLAGQMAFDLPAAGERNSYPPVEPVRCNHFPGQHDCGWCRDEAPSPRIVRPVC